MGLTEIAVIGVGLAMDAVAVSMTNGMCYKKLTKRDYIAMMLFFSIFQGIMPLLGFYAGSLFAKWITKYSGIVIFLILGAIGGNMIRESLGKKEGNCDTDKKLTAAMLFFQAIATSIDAFAVGVGFCAVSVEILPAVLIIALVTAVMVMAAIFIGKRFGNMFESGAELLGGVILIIIGIKGLL